MLASKLILISIEIGLVFWDVISDWFYYFNNDLIPNTNNIYLFIFSNRINSYLDFYFNDFIWNVIFRR